MEVHRPEQPGLTAVGINTFPRLRNSGIILTKSARNACRRITKPIHDCELVRLGCSSLQFKDTIETPLQVHRNMVFAPFASCKAEVKR